VRRSAALAGVAIALAGSGFAWRLRHAAVPVARDAHPFLELHVPRAPAPIAIDAETEGKKVWEPEAGGTGVFKGADGKGMVPYTEAKARWIPGTLYLLLYAGDLDLHGTVTDHDGPVLADDAFRVEIGHGGRVYAVDVSVLGTVADAECAGEAGGTIGRCDPRWESHAVVAVDRDGTLNQVGDNDEEWVVEMAIPLDAVGLGAGQEGDRIPFAVRRCEVGQKGSGACGGFGTGKVHGELVLGPEPGGAQHVASARVDSK
jgi:hypothetical protein